MLTASLETRIVVADPLIPWDKPGRTNFGSVTASRGSIAIPDDLSDQRLTIEHSDTAPVGKFISATDEPHGLVARFHIPETPAGDQLLAEIATGLRTGSSIELKDQVVRSGRLIRGTLDGASAVTKPAFTDSKLMIAADHGDDPKGNRTMDTLTEIAAPEAPPADPTAEPEMPVEDTPAADRLTAAAHNPAPRLTATPKSFFKLLASAGSDRRRLLAALDQATAVDLLPAQQKTWIGEIYSSRTYQRRYASLMQQAPLTGLRWEGWRFTSGKTPTVSEWAGYPNEVTSAEVTTELVSGVASRVAGAGEVDRAFIDFPNPEFWAGYFREQVNAHERLIDQIALAALVGGSTGIAAGTVPSGVATAAAYLVDGAMSIIESERDLPSWAVIGSNLYREFLLTRSDDMLTYLSGALGLDEGDLAGFKIRPSAAASMASKVLVGTATASTLFELPGSPVRVDAVNIESGAAEKGVYGYHGELINDASSLALVSATGTTTTTTTAGTTTTTTTAG